MKKPTKTRTAGKSQGARPRLAKLPRLVSMADCQDLFGPSRSTWYRAAAAGQIRLVKLGRATFLDTESVLAFLDSLPAVVVKPSA